MELALTDSNLMVNAQMDVSEMELALTNGNSMVNAPMVVSLMEPALTDHSSMVNAPMVVSLMELAQTDHSSMVNAPMVDNSTDLALTDGKEDLSDMKGGVVDLTMAWQVDRSVKEGGPGGQVGVVVPADSLSADATAVTTESLSAATGLTVTMVSIPIPIHTTAAAITTERTCPSAADHSVNAPSVVDHLADATKQKAGRDRSDLAMAPTSSDQEEVTWAVVHLLNALVVAVPKATEEDVRLEDVVVHLEEEVARRSRKNPLKQ